MTPLITGLVVWCIAAAVLGPMIGTAFRVMRGDDGDGFDNPDDWGR